MISYGNVLHFPLEASPIKGNDSLGSSFKLEGGRNLSLFIVTLILCLFFNAMVYDGKINLDFSWVPKRGK